MKLRIVSFICIRSFNTYMRRAPSCSKKTDKNFELLEFWDRRVKSESDFFIFTMSRCDIIQVSSLCR